MGSYIVEVTNGSDVGTIENQIDVGFRYADKLNDLNEADIKISGTGSVKRGLLDMGATVKISRNGTLEFKGLIDSMDLLDGGGVSFHVSGFEIRLAQEKGDYANSPWKNIASATIFGDIIGESSYFSAGTVNAGVDIDFRLAKSQSLFNGIGNLAKKTGQDMQIDYTNTEVDILDHRGSSSIVASFNDGLNIRNLRYTRAYPKANKVKVYGKGDGENQIESDDAQGQDAGSQTTYGVIKEIIIDKSIISVAEANALANKLVAQWKDPTKVYDFECMNPNESIVVGDHIYLNSQDKDLTEEEVRIVALERGIRGDTEFLSLQVTNTGFSAVISKRNQILAEIQKMQKDFGTYMQGSGNTMTWGAGINAKTNYPLKVGFYIPSAFVTDEADNLTITSMTFDYDIDKYKKEIGTASYDGSDPQVQNSSGNTQPDVANSSGNTAPGVSGVSGNSGNASWGASYSGNSAGVGSGTLTSGSWTTITNTGTIGVSSDLILYFVTFKNDNALTTRIIRVRASQGGTYYPSSGGTYTEVEAGDYVTIPILMPANVASDDIYVQAQTESGNMDYEFTWNYQIIGRHTHSDGSYTADSHSHADGSYIAANHPHTDGSYDINAADLDNISIGDDVSEAGALNSASVNIYLDFWNGSSWINKHSILNTGSTLETDVDITNSGTYPDASGYWRVRLEPITATADFAQGIVKIKHNLNA